ncbi:ABC transporter ATP-binding protein [Corynebacterium lactis]|uniref:ABC transporter n=1 Tax=Corynebacterium lactis RW2-5 TaxID=1408189 RepID=A0A0K2GXX4_9CORY|nr:ATP-binding cassette domain-containing protein [Corynebacterium lactis]ALA66647.1 ABC transporter [Corynebacterium lactis RW2-5]
MSDKALVAEHISKSFGATDGSAKDVLMDVSLRVEPGQIVGLRGPSGVGKSTLGRILAGLEVPDAGRCLCDGVQIEAVRSRAGQRVRGRIGMVFQSPRRSCDPRMTLGRTIRSALRQGEREDIAGLIQKVGLTPDLLDRFPSQVSDGQLQRAAVARTLAARPRYLVCDEMTAMLDAANSAAIVEVIRGFAANGGGVLMISHEHRLLDAVCDRVVQLDGDMRANVIQF